MQQPFAQHADLSREEAIEPAYRHYALFQSFSWHGICSFYLLLSMI
jgi:hypothetical protein